MFILTFMTKILLPYYCNWIQTHNYLARKQTINDLAKVFVYELSGYEFESSRSHLKFRFLVCFKQEVPWHSGNYRVWIYFEPRTWHDKNIQCHITPKLFQSCFLRIKIYEYFLLIMGVAFVVLQVNVYFQSSNLML